MVTTPDPETHDTSTNEEVSLNSVVVQQDAVDSISPEYEYYIANSLLPRSLMKGTRGMKAQATEFLPQEPLESNDRYELRLSRSSLFNMYRKTATFLAGLVFQSKIIMPDDLSEDLAEDFKDIDLQGNSLETFCKRNFEDGTAEGVRHIYVVAPAVVTKDMSEEERKKLNLRPYFRECKPLDIIGWRTDDEGALTQIRIKETIRKDVGTYGWEDIPAIRVLERGKWEVHVQAADKSSFKLDTHGNSSITDEIPFATYIPGVGWSRLTGETPLQDLAELNLSHWQSSSDQRNILRVARVPTMFSKFVDLKAVAKSSAAMINVDHEHASIQYIEHGGKAIEAGQVDLDKLEGQMELYGLQLTVNRPGNETATAKSINTAASNSSLSSWVIEYESMLRLSLSWFATLRGVDLNTDEVMLNRDFMTAALHALDANVLLLAVDKYILSREIVFTEFKRRGMIDEMSEWDTVREQIEADRQQNTTELTGLLAGGFNPSGTA